MSSKEVYCIKPWVHLHVNTRGMAQACCISGINYGSLNGQSINEVWKGEAIEKLRKKFLSGTPDKRCGACLNREKAGHASLRTETNLKYGASIPEKFDSPVYWDIRFSNVCNFKCRTCWHGNSSKWFEDSLALKNNASDRAIIKAFDNEESFFASWGNSIKNYEEIYFAGGEPLVTEEHYKMLLLLLENGRNDIQLKYNTNLSVLDFKRYDLIHLWKQFENLTIDISIDHIEEKGEYVRKGLQWGIFFKNFKRLKEELPNATIKITPTVSTFNILGIGVIHKYFIKEGLIAIDEIGLNILDRPYFYNVQSLSLDLKKKAEEHLESHLLYLEENKASVKTIAAFHSLKKYLLSEQKSIKGFEKYNDRLDALRNESFHSVFPELLT